MIRIIFKFNIIFHHRNHSTMSHRLSICLRHLLESLFYQITASFVFFLDLKFVCSQVTLPFCLGLLALPCIFGEFNQFLPLKASHPRVLLSQTFSLLKNSAV